MKTLIIIIITITSTIVTFAGNNQNKVATLITKDANSIAQNETTIPNLQNSSNILSDIVSIFSNSKVATTDKIIGTWTYEKPAILFENSNVLKNVGSKAISSVVEKKLQQNLDKYGLKKGMMTITFNKNGKFTQNIGKKKISGTYKIEKKNIKLYYGGKVKQQIFMTQLDNNSLVIVTDATKFLKYVGTLGTLSGVKSLKAINLFLSDMNGIKVGVRMNK